LVDEFLQNTIIAKTDPLIVYALAPDLSGPGEGVGKAFWLGFVKGAARANTALTIASIMMKQYGA